MTAPRSPGLPQAGLPAVYVGNDSGPKPPRVLRTSQSAPFCELRDGRVVIGHRLGDSRWAETSFTRAEWAALLPMLRTVTAQAKEGT